MQALRERVLDTPREGFWPVLIAAIVVEVLCVGVLANAERSRARVDGSFESFVDVRFDVGYVDKDARGFARVIWAQQCASCHGLTGRGDGVAAPQLRFPPPDFGDPEWQASVDDRFIAHVIVEGGASVGLSPTMVGNPELRARPAVVRGLVDIVRSLQR
jgi:hypothetical protein